ncbi:hypothetical protein LMG28688_04153 [Paraburkholderia caffeinitolerans]|uniref:DUF2889 domain-containing protein n=1 Tax=Paraburkholderia caffeinitolerans TaxID=1723730 RepID=A0A6J5GAU4_9BURK|nr:MULTISPECIES: DUF2889 domain-containing protein [Paraburkholderia]CAB3795661.1 hypothetical protein LMG28688_04153 [Paraburkholderia caffeinitolerans]
MPENPTPTAARRLAHTRQIVCTGYAREDGLYDIEATMRDTKGHPATMLFKEVPPGEPIHDMWLRITVDGDLVIHDARALTHAAPTPYCTHINAAYGKLVGVRIGNGFMKEVKARVGGGAGCTHLTELLGPMATTAFQTIMGLRDGSPANMLVGEHAPPLPMIDTCHAWRADGEVVQLVRRNRGQQAAPDSTGADEFAEAGARPA